MAVGMSVPKKEAPCYPEKQGKGRDIKKTRQNWSFNECMRRKKIVTKKTYFWMNPDSLKNRVATFLYIKAAFVRIFKNMKPTQTRLGYTLKVRLIPIPTAMAL